MSEEGGNGGTIPPKDTRFKPGQSGNPGGLAKGTRNRLNASFLNALADDFHAHGKDTIERARLEDPVGYVKVLAGLMPKQVEATQPLDDLNDEQLTAAIAFLRSRLADGVGAGINPPTRTQ